MSLSRMSLTGITSGMSRNSLFASARGHDFEASSDFCYVPQRKCGAGGTGGDGVGGKGAKEAREEAPT